MKNEQVQVSVYLPKKDAEKLAKVAKADDRSMAAYLRRMVHGHLEQATA